MKLEYKVTVEPKIVVGNEEDFYKGYVVGILYNLLEDRFKSVKIEVVSNDC